MSNGPDWTRFNLGTPAIYHITIGGYLDDSWSKQLGGISIQNETTDDGTIITVLHGEMVDQAALFGVLSSLYGLGYPLLSVEYLPKHRS